MYKVMIAEDSKPILRNISRLIESIDSRLEIVETANNGREALKKLETANINILFTDIKMPFVDGLELIEEAKKIQPSIQCVIISGYDDFEYAKQAIRLQVNEYILKPVDFDELKKVINNIISNINREMNHKLERLLNESITNEINNKDLDNKIPIDQYVLVLIRIGLLRRGASIVNKSQFYKYFQEINLDRDLWILDTGFPCEVAVVFHMDDYKICDLTSKCTQIHEGLCTEYSQVNIISSPVLQAISTLREQYYNLSNTLSSLIIIGDSQIFTFASETTVNLNKFHEEANSFQQKFALLIKSRQKNIFEYELRKYISQWEKRKYPAIFVKRFLTIMIDEFNKAFCETDFSVLLDINSKVDRLLDDCQSYEDIYTSMVEYYTSLLDRATITRETSTEELLIDIDSFIKSNIYGSITLQDISDRVNLSPSYISRLMKKKYKVSPMEYYMRLKIEEAKVLLLNNELLIKDISESLCFSDQHYFSKVFKLYTRVSPTEFRNDAVNDRQKHVIK